MKLLKLNEDGIAHWLFGALVVALVAAVGVRALIGSHAATPSSVESSTNKTPNLVFTASNDPKGDLFTSDYNGPAKSILPTATPGPTQLESDG